jgi:hypothetical protein
MRRSQVLLVFMTLLVLCGCGETVNANFMSSGGTIRGQVLAKGRPVDGCVISSPQIHIERHIETASDGRFEVGAESGRVEITAICVDGRSGTAVLNLKAGRASDIEIEVS